MQGIIEANEDGNIAIRLYMTVNKRSFPELVGLLDGLSRRDQNRLVKGLILRGLLAGQQASAAAPMEILRTTRTPETTDGVDEMDSGSVDWLTQEDMDKAFEFAMGAPANANP